MKTKQVIIIVFIVGFVGAVTGALVSGLVLSITKEKDNESVEVSKEVINQYLDLIGSEEVVAEDKEFNDAVEYINDVNEVYVQAGYDSVSTQEFASYDDTIISGTQVVTALSMFQGRDVAIVIQTKEFAELGNKLAINYGAILTADGKASNDSNTPGQYADTNKGTVIGDLEDVKIKFITQQAKTAYVIKFSNNSIITNVSLHKGAGNNYYTGKLHNTNGLVDSTYDTIGTTELDNVAYLYEESRFTSVLIKDTTDSIIGILFREIIE